MPYSLVTLLGKAVRSVARLRGGGSALPGLFVERIQPDFVAKTLAQLPMGVAIVSGTNGKTTTTKMVVELLESQGLTVFTNRTGSNFSRGVAAALLGEVDIKGKLDADIAVLELDEAHGAKFVKIASPRYSLLLNVMRDQLDRFGEIDATAKLLGTIAEATTELTVLNREDTHIAKLAEKTSAQVAYFGLDASLTHLFPNDDQLHESDGPVNQSSHISADVELTDFSDMSATFKIAGKKVTTRLNINGVYNIFNAAAALTFVRGIVKQNLNQDSLIERLSRITPAFGRGETITIGGQPLELVLVKNPGGFRLGLKSFKPEGYATMIAINDNYADGRDMSWLWDVDFSSLKPSSVRAVSGIRAYDMALRLQYDEVEFHTVDTKIEESLRAFIAASPDTPKRIYCTYTAMLAIRKELSRITEVEVIA